MRLRGLLIGVFGVAAILFAIPLSWPLISERVASLIEDRLRRETGLAWRIGGVRLDLPAGVVLHDVSAVSEGVEPLGIAARTARVGGPVSLILSGTGTAQVVAETVSVRGPVTAFALPDRPGSASSALSEVRAAVTGSELSLDEAKRTATGAARKLDLSVVLADGPAKARYRIDLTDRATVVEIDPPAGSGRPIRIALDPKEGPRVAATANAVVQANGIDLGDMRGTIDRAPFSGRFKVETGARPRIDAALRLDALALTDAAAPRPPGVGAGADGLVVPVRADLVPDPAWFALFDGQIGFAIKRLALGPLQASDFELTARVKDGRLDAALESATLYGGTARGRYVLGPEEGSGRHQLSLSLARVRALPLMTDLAGIQGIDGTGTARIDLQGRGATPRALLGAASGQIKVTVAEGRIDGLDLARAVGLTGMGGNLATRLDSLGATLSVAQGQATTEDLRLKTGLVEVEGAGRFDLVGRTLDLRLKPLKVVPGAGGRLNVPITISGSWDNPAISADLAGLAQDPGGTIQSLQDLGSKILDGDGEGLREGLGGFLDSLIPRSDRAPPPRRRPGEFR